jgi:putative phosphoesterase
MKIVVMSGTHLTRLTGEFMQLCSGLCDGADMVIHLGDWERAEILNFLEQYPLEAVSGNMDDYLIRDRLPAKKIVRAGGFRLGLIHGWGPPGGIRDRVARELPGVDAVLFGHTHQPLVLREDGVLWFNPGSVFRGRGPSQKTIGIIRIEDRIDAEIVKI